jgi:DNA-binding MarR family transcriptional regulator
MNWTKIYFVHEVSGTKHLREVIEIETKSKEGIASVDDSYEIMRRMHSLKETMHALIKEQYGGMRITGQQGMFIGMISRHGPQSIGELSERMGIAPSTVSEIVSRMEKAGILVRSKHPSDGRIVLVDLSPEHRKKAKQVIKNSHELWAESIGSATPEEMKDILKGLETLEKVISRVEKNIKGATTP